MIFKAFMNIKTCSVEGDYLEFGCYSARTFRMARNVSGQLGMNLHFYAFDSFLGLPEIKGIDQHGAFGESSFSMGRADFEAKIRRVFRPEEYTVVEGFYDKTLTDDLQKKLPIKKAALIYVDCDLYESTVPVLKFVKNYLQTGTIICFDDYFAYSHDPTKGEERAISEFLQANPDIQFRPWDNFSYYGKAFIVYIPENFY